MKITVITRQRLFGHKPGSVIVVDDSQIVRGLIARNRLDLVDPPELPEFGEEYDGYESGSAPGSNQEFLEQSQRPSGKGSRKTRSKRPAESAGTVPGSLGGHEELPEDHSDEPEGEAYRSSDS